MQELMIKSFFILPMKSNDWSWDRFRYCSISLEISKALSSPSKNLANLSKLKKREKYAIW